jgi:glycosyltransferase involved in cell wall biosynthesis
MAGLPLVTIAIPTYNRMKYLRQAIESALRQSYAEIEVIVSDNCSTDGTAEIVEAIEDPRLVLLRQSTNLGMRGNWNACLERARGEFFLLLSDDDYLEERAIDMLVGGFLEVPEPDKIGLAYCRTWEVDSAGVQRSIDPIPVVLESSREFAMNYFRRKRKIHPCSTLLRTADLRQIGGYVQGGVVLAVDAMVWSRILLRRGAIAAIAEPLASYRIHRGRTTSSSSVGIWRNDMAAFTAVWKTAFQDESRQFQRRFRMATRDYESWELAAIINQTATWRHAGRVAGEYWACRKSFASWAGIRNLLGGISKLLAPEALKRPVRELLLSRQRSRSLRPQES